MKTIAEPFKNKEIKHLPRLADHERWSILKTAGFNTFQIGAELVTFEMLSRGLSAWSHDQKAGYNIGDEAYAGSRNYYHLVDAVKQIFGLTLLVPSHNHIGAEKLLVTTMLKKGQLVLHNRGRSEGLVPWLGGEPVDVTQAQAKEFGTPDKFGADVDLARLGQLLKDNGKDKIAYVYLETCPDGWNNQPISLANLEAAKKLTAAAEVPLVLDMSLALLNGWWNAKAEKCGGDALGAIKELARQADIVIIDAAQDCRSDIGGLICAWKQDHFELFRNEVVAFEGLHTYGGMSGRAMEVFAVGMREMAELEYVAWFDAQLDFLADKLAQAGVPFFRGAKGLSLDVERFLPHLKADDNPKFTLAAALYLHGGIRPRIDGRYGYHQQGEGRRLLTLELPRMAYTNDQLDEIASRIVDLYNHRQQITGLRTVSEGEWTDEAMFEPKSQRLFVLDPAKIIPDNGLWEPWKISVFEPVSVVGKERRREQMAAAGYNTFLLESADVYIDLLTDSGTTAMSAAQWAAMVDTQDSPYSSKSFFDLVEEARESLGFEHCIPTHQGRAAEHIMSQAMIKPGQSVPGNMYFTTTKLHQEMAGGVFVDVIVDEAHDPQSTFIWKGNIDPAKLQAEIDRVGAAQVAYISFETSVNLAGGQPASMQNMREISALCHRHNIPVMYDATRAIENARMIQMKDPAYTHVPVRDILLEMMSYGDGCTISCKKDFLVNMGGMLCCNDDDLADKFRDTLRVWEGELTNGGMDPKDMEAMRLGLIDALDDDYIKARIAQTQELGRKLIAAGIPVVQPIGSHAVFLDARRFLSHLDQEEYPAQALASAIFIETGVRAMERGNVSKGRDPKTGKNYQPKLELVRLTIPRRVYSNHHFDFVVEGIKRLYERRTEISGLEFTYEPKFLRFFQGRFAPKKPWTF